jgi:hypothetical protein
MLKNLFFWWEYIYIYIYIYTLEITKLKPSFMTCQTLTQSSGYSWYGQNVSMLASNNGLLTIIGYNCDNKIIKYLIYIGQTPLQHELYFFPNFMPNPTYLRLSFYLLLILRNCFYQATLGLTLQVYFSTPHTKKKN